LPVTKDVFRQALGHFASGVTIVTTAAENGEKRGITVSAFSSVSLDPPLVLICIDKRASIHEHLRKGDWFAVNVLSAEQEHLSRHFAAKVEIDRFVGIDLVECVSGCPLIAGAVMSLECRVVEMYEGGDHTIFIGVVESASVAGGEPLLYYCGNYAQRAQQVR
jgi:flavin reductase (DIM6/NTAB) family NADH-FMN oxidoreductase RutF